MAAHDLSVEDRFDFDDLYELALRRCGSRPARFVKIGACRSRSALYMAERIHKTGADVQFHIVDTFAGDRHVGDQDLWPEFAASFDRAGLLSLITAHRATSERSAAVFELGSVNFAFIDAGSTFEDVSRDINAWWRRVRPGGLLAGRDYRHSAEVAAAVDRFVAERGLSCAFRTSGSSWAIYKSLTIDAGYCINLPHRTDRHRRAALQFQASGVAGWTRFFNAIDGRNLRHPGSVSDGQAGCAASHLAVLRAALECGHRNVLIFEDDVRLVPNFTARLHAALARCPSTYDLCYLGALCRADWGNYLHPLDDLLSRVGHVYGAHAYIVNMERFMEIEAGIVGLDTVLDHWYARVLHPRSNCYVCTPYLAFQTPGYSDIARAYNRDDPESYSTYVWA